MSRYLDPKADIVFKKIFGEHPTLLISFLNALLPLEPTSTIVNVSYLPTEQVPVIPEFKRTIADVKCTDTQGRVFIVEMQMNWTDSFKQRLLLGTSQAFVKQLKKGQDYRFLQPVYGLGLVAEIYEKTSPQWYHHYQLVQQGSKEKDIIEHLQLIFIELPKFPVQSATEKRLRLLWLRFLREIDEKTKHVSQELLDVPEIAHAIELSEEAAYTPGELNVYESYWDNVRREKTFMADKYAEGLAQGEAQGLAQGEAKGRTEGLAEGEAKGRTEALAEGEATGEARGIEKVARQMLQTTLPLEEISKLTGLSLDALTQLKTKI